MIKVQCISTNSGYHSDLRRGKWYDAKQRIDSDLYFIYYDGTGNVSDNFGVYDKNLFRTLDEKREFRLNKILK